MSRGAYFPLIGVVTATSSLIILYLRMNDHSTIQEMFQLKSITNNGLQSKTKFILQWTSTHVKVMNKEGQNYFIEKKCPVQDCYITSNKEYFSDVSRFDAINFYGPAIANAAIVVPAVRKHNQIYILHSTESPQNYPMCTGFYENFFNWTWTFKLNSVLFNANFSVRDMKNNIVAPHKNAQWIRVENMNPVPDSIKAKLSTKTKAVAWLVSQCKTRSHREEFVWRLQNELSRYSLKVDIYGNCKNSTHSCSPDECWDLFERDYFFYLSFEDSCYEDYVTGEVLYPLQHYVVPIVYGTANYTRFMPEGVYLNALELQEEKLAKEIFKLTSDKEKYFDFFKWHNHYSYHSPEEHPDSDNYCRLCAILHNGTVMKKKFIYTDITKWWNKPSQKVEKCSPVDAPQETKTTTYFGDGE